MRSNQFTINTNPSAITETKQQTNSQSDADASKPTLQPRLSSIPSKVILPSLEKPSNVTPHAPYQPYIAPLRTDATAHSVGALVLPPLSVSMPSQSFARSIFNVPMANPSHTPSISLPSYNSAFPINSTRTNDPSHHAAKKQKSAVFDAKPIHESKAEHDIFETSVNSTTTVLTTHQTITVNDGNYLILQSTHGIRFKLKPHREPGKYYVPIESKDKFYRYTEVPEGTPISTSIGKNKNNEYYATFTAHDGTKHKQQVYEYKCAHISSCYLLFESRKPITIDQFITMKTNRYAKGIHYSVNVNDQWVDVFRRRKLDEVERLSLTKATSQPVMIVSDVVDILPALKGEDSYRV